MLKPVWMATSASCRSVGAELPDIFIAPFLHANWQHIEGNSLPLFVLGVLAAYRSIARFLLVSLIVLVTSGLAVWLFQSSNELTVGASGLIFGYFGYVLARGFLDRNLIDIGVGAVAGVLYWTIASGRPPGHARGQLDRAPRRPGRRHHRRLGGPLPAYRRRQPAATDGRRRLDSPRARPTAPAGTAAGPSRCGAQRGGKSRKSTDDLLRELKEQGF